jgi:hypothetical protein
LLEFLNDPRPHAVSLLSIFLMSLPSVNYILSCRCRKVGIFVSQNKSRFLLFLFFEAGSHHGAWSGLELERLVKLIFALTFVTSAPR